jgi:hypothetical protein
MEELAWAQDRYKKLMILKTYKIQAAGHAHRYVDKVMGKV